MFMDMVFSNITCCSVETWLLICEEVIAVYLHPSCLSVDVS